MVKTSRSKWSFVGQKVKICPKSDNVEPLSNKAQHKPKGTKVNTELIAEYLSANTLKSLSNRVNSALEKDGTPAQLLRGASQSLKALQAKTSDETEQMFIGIYADVFEIGAELAKRGKETEPKAQTPKAPREHWVEEDSEEGQEILAKVKAKREAKAPKPQRKTRAILNEMSKSEMSDLITALLAQAQK